MKVCVKCKIEKPKTEFKPSKYSDGYEGWCNECFRESSREYYHNNREKILAKKKEKYDTGSETYRQRARDYYQEHKEVVCAKAKVYREENADKIKAYNDSDPSRKRRSHLKRTYGITLEEVGQLCIAQHNCCAICGNEFVGEWPDGTTACVDHCHITMKVRGLLCAHCNTGMGHFRDNVDNLQSAINYLKRYEE